jgi:phage shock protein A
MSVFRRMSDVLQQKVNAVLDRAENPEQAMDMAYEKQLEALQQVRRNIADVLTAEKRLEIQENQLQQSVGKLQDQARRALQQGREDLAKVALTRAATAQAQVAGLSQQIEQMKDQEQKLEVMAQKLQAKVEAFRSQKETIKAQYSAAEAQTKIGEAVTGLSDQMADVSLMVDRARDKTERMQARAAAIDELVDTGALDQIGTGDDIDQQLLAAETQSSVEEQMAALKRQLAAPAAAGALAAATEVVRIHGGDQYRISSDDRPQLDDYDRALVAAVEKADEAAFKTAVQQTLDFVRAHGELLKSDEMARSDLVVPSADMSLEEAKAIVEGTPAAAGG